MAKDPNGLSARERLFVEAYVLNGGNATRAYQVAIHPRRVKDNTAAVEAWKLQRIPKVAAVLERRREERLKTLQIAGDQALALISIRARVDLADAYDDRGNLLPFHQWPEYLRLAARTRSGKEGDVEWQFADGLKAAELMAIATGKLKTNVLSVQFDHAAHLAGLDEPPPPEEKT